MQSDIGPRDPRRLTLLPDVMARYVPEEEYVRIDVSLTYKTWCCNGSHEVVDALRALEALLDAAGVEN